jgi:hypothetical protein
MKILLKILTIILILAILLNLIFWLLLYGSGHKVPNETYTTLRNVILVLILLLCGTVYFRIKNR